MNTKIKQEQISAKDMEIFRFMESDTPTLFGQKRWIQDLMQLAMRNPDLKIRLFRLEVVPKIRTVY